VGDSPPLKEFKMNKTNFEHAIYGALLQIAMGLLTGNWRLVAAQA
jgi:hypothetical protein